MRPTFESTIDILVKAYLNDELAHKLCCACAVGNIVAHALGTKPKRLVGPDRVEFDNNLFDNGDTANHWYNTLNNAPSSAGFYQIKTTGYTINELRSIETAFEQAPGEPNKEPGLYRGKCTDPTWMFNGLMAVVDVLADIHGIDLTVKEQAKLLFQKS